MSICESTQCSTQGVDRPSRCCILLCIWPTAYTACGSARLTHMCAFCSCVIWICGASGVSRFLCCFSVRNCVHSQQLHTCTRTYLHFSLYVVLYCYCWYLCKLFLGQRNCFQNWWSAQSEWAPLPFLSKGTNPRQQGNPLTQLATYTTVSTMRALS